MLLEHVEALRVAERVCALHVCLPAHRLYTLGRGLAVLQTNTNAEHRLQGVVGQRPVQEGGVVTEWSSVGTSVALVRILQVGLAKQPERPILLDPPPAVQHAVMQVVERNMSVPFPAIVCTLTVHTPAATPACGTPNSATTTCIVIVAATQCNSKHSSSCTTRTATCSSRSATTVAASSTSKFTAYSSTPACASTTTYITASRTTVLPAAVAFIQACITVCSSTLPTLLLATHRQLPTPSVGVRSAQLHAIGNNGGASTSCAATSQPLGSAPIEVIEVHDTYSMIVMRTCIHWLDDIIANSAPYQLYVTCAHVCADRR